MPIPAAFNRANRTVRERTARMTRKQKLSAAAVSVVGASILAGALAPTAMAATPQAVGTAQAVSHKNAALPTAPGAHKADVGLHLLDTAHASAAKKTEATHAAHKTIKVKDTAMVVSQGHSLDGWIRQALKVMHQHHIPGSFEGIKKNALRESSGNPHAINNWDINAQKGIPSKGLLQVIPPTFATYHVAGTSKNIYDPVANIVAACNYAAHRYGSMDNVDSAY
jgi:hypothetical protein